MFKDEYKKENDSLHPSAEAVERTLELMMSPPKKRRRDLPRRIALVAAACFVVCCTVIGAYNSGAFGNDISGSTVTPGNLAVKLPNSATAESYGEIYQMLSDAGLRDSKWLDYFYGDEVADGALEVEEVPTGNDKAPDHSETNSQVAGVQEGDCVKTDGRYIYVAEGSRLLIYSADKGKIELLSKTELRTGGKTDSGMYSDTIELLLYKDRAAVISTVSERITGSDIPGDLNDEEVDCIIPDCLYYKVTTEAAVYDISDRSSPKKLGTLMQSGYFVSARAVGQYLYVVTNDNGIMLPENPEDTYCYVPYAGIDERTLISPDNISVPETNGIDYCQSFTVISGIDLEKPSETVSSAALYGVGSDFYADTDTLYLYGTHYGSSGRLTSDVNPNEPVSTVISYNTVIYRFSIENGNIDPSGTAMIKGTPLNRYSLDEYNGYLRVAVTVFDDNRNTVSALIVLDGDLNPVGYVGDLGKGELIKSARFYGDTAYIVTFRQTDPLYAVDLSDPTSPRVLSELKIPGFSTYMQSYGNGLLFGFGYDADIETGGTRGLKISMFDISDPTGVSVLDTELLGEQTYFSDNLFKAVTVSSSRELIMFPYESWECTDNGYGELYDKYSVVYSVWTFDRNNGFTLLGSVSEDCTKSFYYYCETRGLYIGDELYVVRIGSGTTVTSYDLGTFTLIDTEVTSG